MNESSLKTAFSLVNERYIVDLAKELIRIPSVTGEEKAVALHTRDILETLGLPVEVSGSEERPIILSTINTDAKPFLIFNGHLDTVPTVSYTHLTLPTKRIV